MSLWPLTLGELVGLFGALLGLPLYLLFRARREAQWLRARLEAVERRAGQRERPSTEVLISRAAQAGADQAAHILMRGVIPADVRTLLGHVGAHLDVIGEALDGITEAVEVYRRPYEIASGTIGATVQDSDK